MWNESWVNAMVDDSCLCDTQIRKHPVATFELSELIHMVAYFCHHLSDNYVDLSDLFIVLSDIYVDLSNHYVDLSEKYHN